MKNKLLLCLLLAAGTLHADNEFANGPRLYAGGSIANMNQGDICNTPFFDGACDSQDFGWKAFGGVQLNPMLGAEISYNRLGSSHMDGLGGNERVKMSNTLTGNAVSGVGYLPLSMNTNINLIGKAGVMFWESQTDQTIGSSKETITDDGVSPLLGGGAQYRLNENLHLRGEWEHLFNVGADSEYETDVDMYSLGLMYSTL